MLHVQCIPLWLEENSALDKIKIVTGVRGYGKTTILGAFSIWLQINGTPKSHIVYFNFDLPGDKPIHTPDELVAEILARTPPEGRVHLLLDEICELQSFNVALSRLYACKRYNIIATGSTRRPISPRFMEYLNGCYIHKIILPSAYKDVSEYPGKNFDARLNAALNIGTFPYTHTHRSSSKEIRTYLTGLWHTILVKDILSYNRMADSRLAELLLEYIYSHLGESVSLRKISSVATIDGHAPSPNTVQSYLNAFDESLLLKRLNKYDVFTNEIIKEGYCFYFADVALGHARYGRLPNNPDNAIRSLIFFELSARKGTGDVYCGRYNKRDFDFVIVKENAAYCWQYAPTTTNGRIPAAVLSTFKHMPPEIPKFVITRGALPKKPVPGITFVTLEQFLTRQK